MTGMTNDQVLTLLDVAIAGLRDGRSTLWTARDFAVLRDYVAALIARNAELEANAARYRWLRGSSVLTPDEFGMGEQLYFGTYAAGTLDAAIDAARGAA